MSSTPLRKDSIRTRAAILDAAEDLLADDPHASFAEISIAAKVSTATVYRHFNDRSSLLVALMERSMEEIEATIGESAPDPISFEDLLRLTSTHQARYQGVLSAVRRGEVTGPKMEELEARTLELFVEPLAVATATKAVRSDLTIDDVIPLLAMIDGALSAVGDRDARADSAARAVGLLLDAIMTPAGRAGDPDTEAQGTPRPRP